MNWIVLYEKSSKIVLTSKTDANSGLLPKGSYITVDMSLPNGRADNKMIPISNRKFSGVKEHLHY